MAVSIITVYSSMNSAKGNPLMFLLSPEQISSHTSDGYTRDGQWNSHFI